MRIAPINNYNYQNNQTNVNKNVKPSFCATAPKPLITNFSKLSNEGKAVIDYVKIGCPKTKEGEKIFQELFVPEIYDLHRECRSVETILSQCGNNPEVIDRTLGKYGLELYGNLPQGSTINNARKGIVETGYWSKYDDLHTNFINYLDYNPSGKLEELEERFGSHAPMWLERHETTGQIHTSLFSYKVVNDLVDTSSIAIEAKTLRSNAIRKYLDRQKNIQTN